jgi:hypothetical protein
MIRLPVIAGMILALAPAGAASEQREKGSKARLSLARGAPLVLRGVNFVPAEHVRVTVSAERQLAKRITADAAGRFVARFRTSFDRCLGLSAVAVGNRGSRARLKTPELLCPPSLVAPR